MSMINITLSASLMIIVIEILRRLTIDKLPKKLFLALWTVTALRLIIPISLPFRYSVQSGIFQLIAAVTGHTFDPSADGEGLGSFASADGSGQISAAGADVQAAAGSSPAAGADMYGATAESAVTGGGEFISGGYIHYTLILFCIWLVGMMAAALYFSVHYIRSVRKFRESVPADDAPAKKIAVKMGIHRKVTVRESDYIRSPLTYKLFRPVILIPKNMSDMLDEEQLTYVYTHELVHIRRFDAVAKFLCTAAVCIHWFNPLVWIMYLLFDRDMELACDETAIRILGSSSRSDYAMTLVRFAEFRTASAAFSSFSKNALTERVTAIMKKSSSSPFAVTSAFVLFLSITLAFGTSANLSQKAASAPDAVTGAGKASSAFSADRVQGLFDLDWISSLGDIVSESGGSGEEKAERELDTPASEPETNNNADSTPVRIQGAGTQNNTYSSTQPASGQENNNRTTNVPASPVNLNVYSQPSGNLNMGGSSDSSGNEVVSGGMSASSANLETYD